MNTKDVAKFVEKTRIQSLPSGVASIGRQKILDTLGVMFAGLDTRAAKIARHFVEAKGGTDETTLFGSDIKVPSSESAFAHTIAATDLDYDDGHWWGVHPAAAIIPALLSVAEMANSTGAEFLEAVVAAYEVHLRSGDIFSPPPKLFLQHCSGTCGAYGVAAGAAKLLRLSNAQIINAIGIAGAHAPIAPLWGLAEAGPMTKECMGWGAKTGVEAALLARLGFTGPPVIFDDENNDRSALKTLGATYEIMNSYFKPYAACRMAHVPIDIVLDIMKGHSLAPDDILKITVETRKWASSLKNSRPVSVEQAIYSIPFSVGAAVADGEVGPKQIREDRLNDPKILKQVDKVELVYNPELDEGYQERWKAAVQIDTQPESYRVQRPFAKGDLQNPFTEEALKAKFLGAASGLLGNKGAEEIMNAILEIEALSQIGQLMTLIKSSIQENRA
ncbi:MAG: MmgE/PrpD family protein [Desulfobacterales bacterium]